MAIHSDRLALRGATYLGSHPFRSGRLAELAIVFDDDGIVVENQYGLELLQFAWEDVRALHADDRDTLEHRVTATRILALGLFAFAVPKKKLASYLTISDETGDWIYSIPGLSAIELDAGLRPLQRRVAATEHHTTGGTAQSDPANRLRQLEKLYGDALITRQEYEERRTAIIDDL